MLAGIDPVQKRKDGAAAAVVKKAEDKALSTTLRMVMDDYLENRRVKGLPLRPKTKLDYKEPLERYCSDWLDKPVSSIDRNTCVPQLLGRGTHCDLALQPADSDRSQDECRRLRYPQRQWCVADNSSAARLDDDDGERTVVYDRYPGGE
jgi:hypothetical protein